MALLSNPFRRVVEHVYLTYDGGTPLVHLSRAPADKDPDLIASMFTAIHNFMDDSFHRMGAGDVRSIELADRHHVAFGRGQWLLLYLVYRGRESNRLERRVENVVRRIEADYANVLRNWNGDMERVRVLGERLSAEWRVRPEGPPDGPSAKGTRG